MIKTIPGWFSAIALFFSLTIPAQASPNIASLQTVKTQRKPVVYAYWAGWSDAKIPDFKFDGLIMAFAMLHPNNDGTYYTDYSKSGNFHDWTGKRRVWEENWLARYWTSGARGYVSYGGASDNEIRRLILDANDQQLDQIAGEIKGNVAKYFFDGVDLDIENWWLHTREENLRFARKLATLVKILRQSMDNDPATFLKPIMITVGLSVADQNENDSYAGTMIPFFSDAKAMEAVSDVNLMSYNTEYPDLYSRLDIFEIYLNRFKLAGVPAEKLIVGVQPCQYYGQFPHTPLEVVTNLGQFIKQGNYGGLFLWGIGAAELCGQGPEHYIRAMQNGLGVN